MSIWVLLIIPAILTFWLIAKYIQLRKFSGMLDHYIKNSVKCKEYEKGKVIDIRAMYSNMWHSINPFKTVYEIIYE